jgi:hypothetical protein
MGLCFVAADTREHTHDLETDQPSPRDVRAVPNLHGQLPLLVSQPVGGCSKGEAVPVLN